MTTLLARRDLLLCMVEPDERAPIRSAAVGAENFVATGNGAADGTTIVCAALTGATADIYVGQLVECCGPDTSLNYRHVKEVVEFNTVTDTLTTDPWPAQSTTGEQYRMLTPPDPLVVETTGGGTDSVSTLRNEANDYFDDGDFIVSRRADNIAEGQARAITGFTGATGTFAQDNWSANTAIGDLSHVRRPLKTWGPAKVALAVEDLAQEAQRGDFSSEQSIRGSRGGTVEFTLPWKGSGTAAGNGVAAIPPVEARRPLGALFTEIISTGRVTVAQGASPNADSTTLFHVADGQASSFPVGSLVMSNGRVAVVTATAAQGVNPDEITVNPAFGRIPTVGETVYGGVAYHPRQTGALTLTFEHYRGMRRREVLYGCMPALKLAGCGRNQIAGLQFAYRSVYAYGTRPLAVPALVPTHSAIVPVAANDSYVTLASGTALRVDDWSVDLALEIVEEPIASLPNGIAGLVLVGWKPIITFVLQLDDVAPNNAELEYERYLASSSFSFMGQIDRRPGHTKAFYGHVCRHLGPTYETVDNLHRVTCRAEINPSGVSGLPDWLLGTV